MKRISSKRMSEDDTRLFDSHVNLIQLLTMCCWGKNAFTEIQCQSLIPIAFIIRTVIDEDTLPSLQTVLLEFFLHVGFLPSFFFFFCPR